MESDGSFELERTRSFTGDEEEHPPAKKHKGEREWSDVSETKYQMFLHACGCAACQNSTPCDHDHSFVKLLPGRSNRDKRKYARKQISDGTITCRSDVLYHNKRVILLPEQVESKLKDLHAPSGADAKAHRQAGGIRRTFTERIGRAALE